MNIFVIFDFVTRLQKLRKEKKMSGLVTYFDTCMEVTFFRTVLSDEKSAESWFNGAYIMPVWGG